MLVPPGVLLQNSGGPPPPSSGIEAIQTVTGTTTGTSVTLTFGSLTDAAQCVPFCSVAITAGTMGFEQSDNITWTANVFDDAGTVKCTLTRTTAPSAVTWSFCVSVAQFVATYVVAKYSGSYSSDSTNGDSDIAITSVDTAHAFVLGTARVTTGGFQNGDTNRAFRLTSSTNVRMYNRFSNTVEGNYVIYVVSDPDEGMVVEHTFAQQSAGTWVNVDLTVATDPRDNLVIASSNLNVNGGYYTQRNSISCEALNATTIRFTRPSGYNNGNPSRFVAQVITIPGVTVQSGVHAWASADMSEVKTVTSVDTAQAAALSLVPGNMLNSQNDAAFDSAATAHQFTRIQLTSDTQVTLTRGPTTGVDAGRVGYQVLSF